ncbi:MAG: hypothetical protein KGL42_15120, partial [Betaproteobacteria bacterium]|nr:hypothetical protein [Betaproteobacteria bacterium]
MSLTYRPNDDALLASVYGVDPALLGAVMGPSQTSAVRLANTLALRKAVTWAAANGHHVLINGILECEIPTSGTNLVSYGSYSVGVTLPSGTTIRGADALSSRIAWFPDNTDLTIFFLIDARAAQRKVQFIDFEMRAPPTVVASTLRTYSVYHIGATSSSYTDLVRNRGMLYTGGAYSLFNSSFGNGTIEHLDTIFSGGFLGTECYGSDLAKFFHARNTKFTNSADHAVYIHPSISFNVEGCEFNTVGYYAWHNYGVSPTLAPQYQIFRGNHVASTCTRGIITGKLGEVLVEHNVFENGEISMYGDARIIGNRFSGAGSAINIAGGHSNHQR